MSLYKTALLSESKQILISCCKHLVLCEFKVKHFAFKMFFTIIYEILLLFAHSVYSFEIVNGYEVDIPAVRDDSVVINAKVDYYFKSCSLKKNGSQICQMTWEKPPWSRSHSEKLSCSPLFNRVTYAGGGSFYVCKFVVTNVQENGKKHKFPLYLSSSSMTSNT